MARAASHRHSTNILGQFGLGKFVATAGLLLSSLGLRAHNDTTAVAHNDTTKTINLAHAQLPPTFEVNQVDSGEVEVDDFATEEVDDSEFDTEEEIGHDHDHDHDHDAPVANKEKKSSHSKGNKPRHLIPNKAFVESIKQNQYFPGIMGRLDGRLPEQDVAEAIANLASRESKYGRDAQGKYNISLYAENPDPKMTASGPYGFINSTRAAHMKKLGLEHRDNLSPEQQLQLENTLYLGAELDGNLFNAIDFIEGHLKEQGIQTFFMTDLKGREVRVDVDDPRLVLGIAFMHNFGPGTFKKAVKQEGVIGEITHADGTKEKYFRMSSVFHTSAGDQDSFDHLMAAGFDLSLSDEELSPAYFREADAAKTNLIANYRRKDVTEREINELDPRLAIRVSAFMDAAKKANPKAKIWINDGHRTRDEQEHAHDHLGGAEPGSIGHEAGLAVDIHRGVMADWMDKHRHEFGLGYTYKKHHHFEIKEPATRDYTRAQASLRRRGLEPENQYAVDVVLTDTAARNAELALLRAEANTDVAGAENAVVTVSSTADDEYFYSLTNKNEEANGSGMLEYVVDGLEAVGEFGSEALDWAGKALSGLSWPFGKPNPEDQNSDDPAIAQVLRSGRLAVKQAINTPERGAGSAPPQEDLIIQLHQNGQPVPKEIRVLEGKADDIGPIELIDNSYPAGTVISWNDNGQQEVITETTVDAGEEVAVDTDTPAPVVTKKFKQNKDEVCSDMFRDKYFGQTISIEGVGTREVNEAFLKEAQEIYGGKRANAVIARAINNFEKRSTQELAENPDLCAISAKSKLAKGLTLAAGPAA